MELKNKRVVVTGASSGIGLELTKKLLEENCRVVAVARTMNEVSYEHENLYKLTSDISTAEGVESVFDFALKTLQRIDLFVANAGFGYCEKLGDPDWDHITAIYNTNFTSVVYSAQKMKKLYDQEPYNFVVTGSAVSILPLPWYALYSSTKAAIGNFGTGYRWELENNQHFQVVYPVATKTGFFEKAGGCPIPANPQDVDTVVSAMISGIRKDKAEIYPSKLFYVGWKINNIIPVIFRKIADLEHKKAKNYLDGKSRR